MALTVGLGMAGRRCSFGAGLVFLVVARRAAACTTHYECSGDTYCDRNNWCWSCDMVPSPCDAIDNDCSTPCGSTASGGGGGDVDWGGDDVACVGELLACVFDSECVRIVEACDDGCEYSLEPLRDNGCCSNRACYDLHDCMIDNGQVSDDETCDDYNMGAVLVVLIVALVASIAGIAACAYCCCCRKQEQAQNQVTVQQPQPQAQQVIMATPVGQPPAQALGQFNVTVPAGVQPGQSLQVQSPNTGMMLAVQVPAGYQAGMTFAVQG